MNAVQCTMLGLTIAMGGLACSAQDAKIPFRQIEKDTQLSASATVPASEAAVSHSYEMSSGSPTSAGFVLVPPHQLAPGLSARDSSCSMVCIWAWQFSTWR